MHLPVIMDIIVLYGYGAYYIISAYIQVFKRPWVMSLHASITRDEYYIPKDLHASNSLSMCSRARQVCSSKHTRVQ